MQEPCPVPCLGAPPPESKLLLCTAAASGQMLMDYLGLEKVIWLWRGMEGDMEVVNGAVPVLFRQHVEGSYSCRGIIWCMKRTRCASCACCLRHPGLCSSGGC